MDTSDIELVALARLQRITQLEEALRPFAMYAEQMAQAWGQRDDSVFYGVKRPGAHQITYGDFRKAARLYGERPARRESNTNKCPACGAMFTDGGTCAMGGCPMGGDF